MRIATFNLESLDLPPRANRPIEARIEMLRPELLRARADILCLQEVNAQHIAGEPHRVLAALDRLLDGTLYATYARAVSEMAPGLGVADVHNLVTLSRYPILERRSVRHDLVPPLRYRSLTARPPATGDDAIGFDRPVLLTRIDAPGESPLTVVNCHFRAPLASAIHGQKRAPFVWETVAGWAEGFALSAMRRNAQALEVRLLVDSLLDADPHADILIAGDLNAEDYDTPLRILQGAEQDTGNGALAARALVLLDRAIPSDRRYSVIHQGRPQMLDHILASRSLYARVSSIEVHNEALADEAVGFARVDRPTGSYHALVVIDVVDNVS